MSDDAIYTVPKDGLPSMWELKSIHDLVGNDGVFVDGDWVESKDQDPNGDVRLIQLADVGDGGYRNKSNRFLTLKRAKELGCTFLQKGDVLIARMPDPLGRACIFPGDAKQSVTVVDVAIVRPGNDSFDTKWLMYFINALAFRSVVASLEAGSTRKRISRKNLGKIHLPVPPLTQQKRIAAEIDTQFSRLDEAVSLLKRIQANLKRYKAAVLKAAVEGKLTEQWRKDHPVVEPADQLLKRILAERRAKWEESVGAKQGLSASPGFGDVGNNGGNCIKGEAGESFASPLPKMKAKVIKPKDDSWKKKYKEPVGPDTANLPELPEGWVWTSTGELCDCIVPNRDKPKTFSGDIPWITLPDFNDNSINIYRSKSEMGLSKEETNKFNARIIPKGSVVMSCVGRFGIVGIAQSDIVINQQLHGFLMPTEIVKEYFAYAIKTQVPYMNAISTATTIAYLNKENCNSVPIALPSHREQKEIHAEIDRRLSVTEELEATILTNLKRAERLRQTILQQAFMGGLFS